MILISFLSLSLRRRRLNFHLLFPFSVLLLLRRRQEIGRESAVCPAAAAAAPLLPFKGFYIHSAAPEKIWLLSLLLLLLS